MLAKVVTRRRLGECEDDLVYWRSRPFAERIAHVQTLRVEYHGWSDGAGPRLQRVHRVLRRP
ncbi:MAG: hypothetical protein ACT4RN_04810 [Pseudonocardia sp.]